MTRPTITALALLLATPAAAQSWQFEPHGSTVQLRDTLEPNAVAEVWFNNTTGDSGARMTHNLRLGDVDVTVTLGRPEADEITVDPPEGFWADPRTLTLPDGQSGVIYIRPLNGLGMM